MNESTEKEKDRQDRKTHASLYINQSLRKVSLSGFRIRIISTTLHFTIKRRRQEL